MAFDIKGAISDGYTKTEIADYLSSEHGFDVSGARKDGYSDDEIIQHLTNTVPQQDEGFFPNAWELAKQGGERLAKGLPLAADVASGRFSEEAPRQLSESINRPQFKPKELQQAEKNISESVSGWDNAKGAWESSKVLGNMLYSIGKEAVSNPKGIAYLSAEQVANMVPAMAGLIVGGKLGTLGGPAAPVTVPGGAFVGSVAGGMIPEMALEVSGYVQEELGKRGLEPTENNIRLLLQDPTISNSIIDKTRKKAAGTSITDAALTMIGGRVAGRPMALAKKGIPVSLASKAGHGLAGVGIDVAGEGVSEAAGQGLATGNVNMGDVALEMAGGVGGAFLEVPAAAKFARAEAINRIGRNKATSEQSTQPPTQPIEETPQASQTFDTYDDFTRAYGEGATEEELKGKRDEYAQRPDANPETLNDIDGLLGAIRTEQAETESDNSIEELKALRESGGLSDNELLDNVGKLIERYPDKTDKIKSAFPDIPVTLKEAIQKTKTVTPFTEESDTLNQNIIDNITILKKNDKIEGGQNGTLQTETEIETTAPTADLAAQDSIKGKQEAAGTAPTLESAEPKADLPSAETVTEPSVAGAVPAAAPTEETEAQTAPALPKPPEDSISGKVEAAESIKPLRMDGTTRPERKKTAPLPGFDSLPQATKDKFNTAFETKDVQKMQEYLGLSNKNLRAEFESRTGVKLPKTVKGTDQAVSDYFAKPAEPIPPVEAAEAEPSEIFIRKAERKDLGRIQQSLKAIPAKEGYEVVYRPADKTHGKSIWYKKLDGQSQGADAKREAKGRIEELGAEQKPESPKQEEQKADEKAPATENVNKVIPATKTAEKNVTTPKEQKAYVLDKVDDLVIKARKRWKEQIDDRLSDKEIDEAVSRGKYGSETAEESVVVIEVPNDGRYKVPNTLRNLLLFKKQFKAMSTNTAPPDIKPPMPSKKPTGKPISDIQKEAWEDYKNLYRDYQREGRTEEAAEMKQAMKEEYPELYDEIEKAEAAEKEGLVEDYKDYSDTTKEQAEADRWHKIVADMNNKKITLKSLSNEFSGKTPSSKDVYQKSNSVYDRLNYKIKQAEETKETIKTRYPELYNEMFAETKFQRGSKSTGMKASDVQSVTDKVTSSIQSPPKVNVVQSNENCPQEVQDIMEREGITDAMGFTWNGEVYLIADNLRNAEESLRILAHELTHSGLGKFFQRQTKGKLMPVRVKYEALMDAIYRAHHTEIEKIANTTHTHLDMRTVKGRRQACEEWLCNQTYESQPKWYDKLVAIFHDLLRVIGLDVKLSDAEVRVVLQDAFKEFGSEGVNFMTAWQGGPYDFNQEVLVESPDGTREYLVGTPDVMPQIPAGYKVIKEFPKGRHRSDKIGTGEGAQAYGHGHYFGSKREVAEYYKRALEKTTRAHNTFDGKKLSYELLRSMERSKDPVERQMAHTYGLHPTSSKDIRPIIQKRIDDLEKQLVPLRQGLAEIRNPEPGTIYSWSVNDYEDRIHGIEMERDRLEEAKKRSNYFPEKKSGRIYQVELAPAEDEYLLWDKQTPNKLWAKILTQIRKEGNDAIWEGNKNPYGLIGNETGSRLYSSLSKSLGSDKAASDFLHRAGIRGIKYLDGTSRGQGGYQVTWANGKIGSQKFQSKEQAQFLADSYIEDYGKAKIEWVDADDASHNYVIFDESDIEITAKFQRRSPVRRSQPMFSRSEDSNKHWWEGMDIQKQLNSLPLKFWQKPRNFIAMGYVPITRAEADQLYYDGLDIFVAHVNINGELDTTGNEGLFMRPLNFYGYAHRTYNNGKWETNQKARDLYEGYRNRYEESVKTIPVRTRADIAKEGMRADAGIQALSKVAENEAKFQRQEKEAFDEASEPTPPEYDLGDLESKRKDINDYVNRTRRSLEFPEMVMLARDLLGGKFPIVMAKLRSAFGNSALGKFIPQGEGNILLKAGIFSDIDTASKVLAHEIGHLVDYLPNHMMTRGNILGRIASLNRYMKNYLEEFKGAPGLLTDEDRKRLHKEAREQIKSEEKPDEVIVEEIIKEIPQYEYTGITPEIILDLMKGRVEGKIAPELYEYLQRAETKEKKQIVLKALKDMVDERVAQFGSKKQVGTETVRETVERVIPGVKYDQQTIYKRFKELLQKEVDKRVLYRKEVISDELKKLTKLWSPFDDSVNSSYRKYRWSSKELYADAFSVFINYPELMQKEAPTFYKAFLSWIESKPEVKETYDAYQKLAFDREAVQGRREKYIYEMQKGHKTKEQEVMEQIEAERKISPRSILRELYRGLIDRNIGMMDAIKKLQKAGKISPANALKYFKEERNYLAAEADFYLEEVKNKIIDPLKNAGFTEDDIGYLGTLMRTATQRRDVANPGGMGGYFSDEQIEHLKNKLGTERFNTLKGLLEKFSDLRQELVIPKLEEAGMYSEALLNTMKTQKNYLTFNVTKFLDKMYGGMAQGALGKVYHTLGTFQDIQNPFVATIFKDISLMRAAEITKYKKELHKTFSENEELQDQIQPAEKKFNGTAQVFVEPKDPKMGMISYLKNGKVEAFYITKEIADDFNYNSIEAMHILKFFNALMMPVKALLVNRNPIWMFRNVVRDYLGTAQNIPGATVTNLLPYYRKAFMDAWGEVMQGKKLDVVQAMKKGKMLVIDRQYHLSDDMSDDTEFDKLYAKFGHYGEAKRKGVIEPLMKAWDFLGDLGKVSERAGKIAGYRWMKENTNMTEREIGHVVRSRIGTPDVYRRGAWQLVTNNLFLYSNVGKEGFRSSWESFQDDKAAYTWKLVKYNIMPKAVLALAALGAFGDDAEDIIKRISNYDKANYLVVPFNKTADGRAVYLRMPQSYTGQVLGAIMWDIFNLEFKKATESVAEMQPYSFNPVIKAVLNWGLYAMDTNPQDWYRGQNIVNRKEWDAGEPYRLIEMSKNTWNSLGGGLLYKFNKGQDPKGVWEQISSLPGLNILGSFLKESNQGLKEEYYKASQKAKQASALKSLDKDEAVAKRERNKRKLSEAKSLLRKGFINYDTYKEAVERYQ